MSEIPALDFVVPAIPDAAEIPLARALKQQIPDFPWNRLRDLCASGKVTVDGELVRDSRRSISSGAHITVNPTASSHPEVQAARSMAIHILHEDSQIVVVDKPSGIATVPFEDQEPVTVLDLVRQVWRQTGAADPRSPLYVVQRLDKETSGVMVFAKTEQARVILEAQFRKHNLEREYLAIVHGEVEVDQETFLSYIAPDRGDGLRGSVKAAALGKKAVTHMSVVERLQNATLVSCTLETGRTHQVRIHLSESGHPLVGERLYTRGYAGNLIEAPRLALHAVKLAFRHPGNHNPVRFVVPLPPDLQALVRTLGGHSAPGERVNPAVKQEQRRWAHEVRDWWAESPEETEARLRGKPIRPTTPRETRPERTTSARPGAARPSGERTGGDRARGEHGRPGGARGTGERPARRSFERPKGERYQGDRSERPARPAAEPRRAPASAPVIEASEVPARAFTRGEGERPARAFTRGEGDRPPRAFTRDEGERPARPARPTFGGGDERPARPARRDFEAPRGGDERPARPARPSFGGGDERPARPARRDFESPRGGDERPARPARPSFGGGDERPARPARRDFEAPRGGDERPARPSRPSFGGGDERPARPARRDFEAPRGGDERPARPARPSFGGGDERPARPARRDFEAPRGGDERPTRPTRPSFGGGDERPARPARRDFEAPRGGDERPARPARPSFGGEDERPARPARRDFETPRGGDERPARPSRPSFGGGDERPARPSRPSFGGGDERPARPTFEPAQGGEWGRAGHRSERSESRTAGSESTFRAAEEGVSPTAPRKRPVSNAPRHESSGRFEGGRFETERSSGRGDSRAPRGYAEERGTFERPRPDRGRDAGPGDWGHQDGADGGAGGSRKLVRPPVFDEAADRKRRKKALDALGGEVQGLVAESFRKKGRD